MKSCMPGVISAGAGRVCPCFATAAPTIPALVPVLASAERGSDVLAPMATPSLGGMTIEILTMLVVPVLYCAVKELKLKTQSARPD